MASTRTTFTLDDSLAERAHELGINISAAAHDGVAAAVRAALAEASRSFLTREPERPDSFWTEAEAWSEEVNRGEVWLAQVGQQAQTGATRLTPTSR